MVKKLNILVILLVVMLQACSSLPSSDSLTSVVGVSNMEKALQDLEDPDKQAGFKEAINHVVSAISKDENYVRIPLNSQEQKEWFTARAFLLWDGEITKEQFIKFGKEAYPGYESSFTTIASLLAP